MRILIWGCGAIGGTVAVYWRNSGVDVTGVDANEDHVKVIQDRGLRVYGPIGETVAKIPMYWPEELSGAFDCVVLSVKSDQTAFSCRQLSRFMSPNGFIVSFQNGLNELTISEIVGKERTVGAFVNWSAEYMEPGTLWLGGLGALVIGELDGRASGRTERFLSICRTFNRDARLSEDIMGFLWGKLIYGSFLRITAIANLSIVDGLNDATCRQACLHVAREIIEVADRNGIALRAFDGFDPHAFRPNVNGDSIDRAFDAMVGFNAGSAITHASVWRDLAIRKRKTDTDAQYAPFFSIASNSGFAVPTMNGLIDTFGKIESGAAALGRKAVLDICSLKE